MNTNQLKAVNRTRKLVTLLDNLDEKNEYWNQAVVDIAFAVDQFDYGDSEKGKTILNNVFVGLKKEIDRVKEELLEL